MEPRAWAGEPGTFLYFQFENLLLADLFFGDVVLFGDFRAVRTGFLIAHCWHLTGKPPLGKEIPDGGLLQNRLPRVRFALRTETGQEIEPT